jgi:pimeloyl-ACP methyl ester carboxylesterase
VAAAGALAAACATEVQDPLAVAPPDAPTTEVPPDLPPVDGEPVVLPVEQELRWGDCDGDVPDAEIDGTLQCATLLVRVDHADPGSETLSVALARRPATRGTAEGTIVMNPGGPGGSGVDSVARNGGSVPDALRERYDVVGFDPRGAHRSGQVTCVGDEEFHRYLDQVDALPDLADAAALEDYQARVVAFEEACADRHGELLTRLGTRFVARDVEALRRALGVEQLTWFGYSYGTLLGTVYAQEFPTRVRALVMDGPVITDVDPVEKARIDLDGLQRGFERFADDCDRRGDRCALSRHGGGRAALDAVVRRVRAGGLDGYYAVGSYEAATGVPGRWPMSEGRLGYALVVAIYNEDSWPVLEDALAAVLDEDWGGQLRFLADVYLSGFEIDPPFGTHGEQTFWALRCADRDPDLTVASVREGFEQETRRYGDPYAGRPLYVAGWRIPNVWCLDGVWPEPAEWLGSARVDADEPPPSITFGATGDFATPIEYADRLADALGGGHVVRVEASTHVTISTNRCQQELVVAFVDDPTAPPARTDC